MYAAVREELPARGYGMYEISNYAQPGRESQHNLTSSLIFSLVLPTDMGLSIRRLPRSPSHHYHRSRQFPQRRRLLHRCPSPSHLKQLRRYPHQ